MRNAVLGFSLFMLIAIIGIIVGHIAGVVGLVTDHASIEDFYFITPISIALIVTNILVVIGLQKRKLWAYSLAAIELIVVSIHSLLNVAAQEWEAMLIALVAVAVLVSLYLDFKTQPLLSSAE